MSPSEKSSGPAWVENMRALMERQKMNPRSLSIRAGLNPAAVRDMFEGRSRFPRYDTVQALAEALGTTPAQLMSGEKNAATRLKNEALGHDVELLTEIIARLQEVAAETGRALSPREFAAMSASIYRRLNESGDSPKKNLQAVKVQIVDLMEFNKLRQKRGKSS